MKKVIFLLLIFIRILSFSFENNYSNEIEKLANDKKAIKMYYLSQNNDGIIKKWYLYNDNVFQKEFEANEQRAINMLQDKNSIFVICGKVKKLSSGYSNNEYVIEFENDITVYLNTGLYEVDGKLEYTLKKETKEKYLKLNKGDYVCVASNDFLMNMHTGKTFMSAEFLDEISVFKFVQKIKEQNNI
jgi:predicted MPP superfamily phosphohydrolase